MKMPDNPHFPNGYREADLSLRSRSTSTLIDPLLDAAKENPLSAALIGMGVLWLFLGGTRTSLLGGHGRKSIFRGAAEAAGAGATSVASAAGRVESTISGAVADAGHSVASHMADLGHSLEGAATAVPRASEAAYAATADLATRSADAVASGASNAARYLRHSGESVSSVLHENLGELFERHPLVLGAVGLAIGAGIAASVPPTELEHKLMGEASDRVQGQVRHVAEQAKELAAASLDEVKAQSVMPRGSGR